jgi:hypothetical protein
MKNQDRRKQKLYYGSIPAFSTQQSFGGCATLHLNAYRHIAKAHTLALTHAAEIYFSQKSTERIPAMSFKSLVLLSIGILLVALGCSIISPPLFGIATGATLGILGGLGGILLAAFIIMVVFFGVGILIAAILGLVGVILLAVALPFLSPFLIVIIPIVILLKLAGRK